MNDVIFVKDLKVSSKVAILDDPDQPLVTVLSTAEEVAETTQAPTAEVVSEEKKEEEKK
jgi:hypothetical protein